MKNKRNDLTADLNPKNVAGRRYMLTEALGGKSVLIKDDLMKEGGESDFYHDGCEALLDLLRMCFDYP